MIKSMTGYGRSEGEQNNIYYVVELRSVNHRFCEISTRLQKVFVPLENKIKKMIQSRFSRGRIDVTISANGLNGENKRLQINKELAKQYCSLLN
ncbi:MAG: YicC/YloC family endoribonuclease [Nitrospirota bacterium]